MQGTGVITGALFAPRGDDPNCQHELPRHRSRSRGQMQEVRLRSKKATASCANAETHNKFPMHATLLRQIPQNFVFVEMILGFPPISASNLSEGTTLTRILDLCPLGNIQEHVWCEMGVPKWGQPKIDGLSFLLENPIQMDDVRVSPSQENPPNPYAVTTQAIATTQPCRSFFESMMKLRQLGFIFSSNSTNLAGEFLSWPRRSQILQVLNPSSRIESEDSTWNRLFPDPPLGKNLPLVS